VRIRTPAPAVRALVSRDVTGSKSSPNLAVTAPGSCLVRPASASMNAARHPGAMTWIAPSPPALADGPLVGDDRPILEGFLAWERSTLRNICAGLTAGQLVQRPIPASNLSLLGLVRHLAKVERTWFRQRAAGEPVGPMYDQALGKDADFNELDPALAEQDFARFDEEIRLADAAAAGLAFDDTFLLDGEPCSLRLVYVHMIAEYSRHNGHADLLRESIDGTTGR
jgi:Protein of unknown function (DUF664)